MLRRQAKVQPSHCAENPRPRESGDGPRAPSEPSLVSGPKHNGAAFMAYPGSPQGSTGGTSMRLVVGIIFGCALTVGGAYVADTVSAAGAKPLMVNWDVVAKNLDSVTTLARAG